MLVRDSAENKSSVAKSAASISAAALHSGALARWKILDSPPLLTLASLLSHKALGRCH